ncbi:olfactory receptor 8D1-like [Discoglossus pictus]
MEQQYEEWFSVELREAMKQKGIPRRKGDQQAVMIAALRKNDAEHGEAEELDMDQINQTMITYFIVEGFSEFPTFHLPIFVLVLLIYCLTLGGNTTIFLLVCLDPHLHTPMYFFLGNLSIFDMSSTTIALHKILVTFVSRDNTVSRPKCLGQMFAFSSFSMDELFILTAMSYDRYVAICNPLHYNMVMSRRICALLAIVCWVLGFTAMLPFLVLLSNSCYKSNIINHFFCDFVPISLVTCRQTVLMKVLIFTIAMCGVVIFPFFLTFISYVFIIANILKIRTSIGRRKAFYTCSSQLIVVVLLYGLITFQYIKPATVESLKYNKLFALFNTVAVPLLNPLIYSLKNKDVKTAMRRQLRRSKVLDAV